MMSNNHLPTAYFMPVSDVLLNRKQQAVAIIKRHTLYSGGAGFSPIPFTDALAMTGIQVVMVRKLARVYQVDFANQWSKTLGSAFLASVGSVTGLKFIPGIGTILGAMSSASIGAASTYAMGQIFAQHFDQGGTLLDFDPIVSRKYFKKELEKGKQFIMSKKNGLHTLAPPPPKVVLQQLLEDSRQHCADVKALQEEIARLKALKAAKKAQDVTNLKIIEGIGPKTEEALKAAGLRNWQHLANMEAYVIKELLDAAEGNFKLADPTSWPHQAQLAVEGKFEELKQLQDTLIGGKYPTE